MGPSSLLSVPLYTFLILSLIGTYLPLRYSSTVNRNSFLSSVEAINSDGDHGNEGNHHSSSVPSSSVSVKENDEDIYFIPHIVRTCYPSGDEAFYSLVSSIHKEPSLASTVDGESAEEGEEYERNTLSSSSSSSLDTNYATSTIVLLPMSTVSSSSSDPASSSTSTSTSTSTATSPSTPSPSPSLPSTVIQRLLTSYYGSPNIFIVDIVNDTIDNNLKPETLKRLGIYLQSPIYAQSLVNPHNAIHCPSVATKNEHDFIAAATSSSSSENFCTCSSSSSARHRTCVSPHHYQQQHIIVVTGLHQLSSDNILSVDIFSRLLEKEVLTINSHQKIYLKNVSLVTLVDIDTEVVTETEKVSESGVTVDGEVAMDSDSSSFSKSSPLIGTGTTDNNVSKYLQSLQNQWKSFYRTYQLTHQKHHSKSSSHLYQGNVLTIGAIFNRLLNRQPILFPIVSASSFSTSSSVSSLSSSGSNCTFLLEKYSTLSVRQRRETSKRFWDNQLVAALFGITAGGLIVGCLYYAMHGTGSNGNSYSSTYNNNKNSIHRSTNGRSTTSTTHTAPKRRLSTAPTGRTM